MFDEIKSRVDVRDLLSYYGIEGKIFKAGCHDEKTPSAVVKNNKIHCFGCSTTFSSIDYVMLKENCDSKTACKRLNEIFNLGIGFELTEQEKQEQARKRKIQELKRLISKTKKKYRDYNQLRFIDFHRWLWESKPKTKRFIMRLELLQEIEIIINLKNIPDFDIWIKQINFKE
jgi:DNA primase